MTPAPAVTVTASGEPPTDTASPAPLTLRPPRAENSSEIGPGIRRTDSVRRSAVASYDTWFQRRAYPSVAMSAPVQIHEGLQEAVSCAPGPGEVPPNWTWVVVSAAAVNQVP